MALRIRSRLERATPTVPEAEAFLGDELLSVPTTAGGTALASVPAGARHAYIQNTGTVDVIARPKSGSLGGDPDSTHGFTIAASDDFDWTADPSLLKFLGSGGTGSVYVMYFGEA